MLSLIRFTRLTICLSNTPEHGAEITVHRAGPNGSPAGWGPLPLPLMSRGWGTMVIPLPHLRWHRAYRLRRFGLLRVHRLQDRVLRALGASGYQSGRVVLNPLARQHFEADRRALWGARV